MDGLERLERALAVAAESEPAAAHAAAVTLENLLGRGLHQASDETPASAWSGSVLSRDGYPVELGFVPGMPGLRYTVELPPAGPSVASGPPGPSGGAAPGADRWSRTLAAARRMGADVPPSLAAPLLDPVRRAQTGTGEPLRYGAWLSGRHTAERTRLKLYAEIPGGSAPLWRPWESTLLERPAPLPTRCPALRMVGIDLADLTDRDHHTEQPGRSEASRPSGRIELYYDLSSLHPSEVALLAERVGLEERAPEILDLLREAVCLPFTHELPARCDWGFSYALEVEPSGSGRLRTRPLAFTLYTFANALFGGDGKIRRAILALGRSRGWDLSLYERISEPLAARRGFVTCHGVFGVTVTADRARPALGTWGLTPPSVRRDDLSNGADGKPLGRLDRPGRFDGPLPAATAGGRR